MIKLWIRNFWLIKASTLFYLVASNPTAAQIIPDATLPVNSLVTPQGTTSLIEGGTRAGSNLFHSFSQFSVLTGGTAYFNNALDVQNIFSRVTGASVSNIDGILKANGTANLFLLNPNGIIFGSNASLDVGGSFVGSTANAIAFSNEGFFSATTPNNPAVLTINPSAFLFNQLAAQPITNQATLQVNQGRSLLLLGGNISLDGGKLLAPGGRVELAGLAALGNVGLDTANNNFGLTFTDGVKKADVLLTNGSEINVSASGGGNIAINAQNLNIVGASILLAGISGVGSSSSVAGNIEINTIGANTFDSGSFIANTVQPGSVGKGGDINITTGSLSVLGGAQLQTATFGAGDAGTVNINALDTVAFNGVANDGFSSIALAQVGADAVGNGGNINITGRSVSLINGGGLSVSTVGSGNAGSVTINAQDTVLLDRGYILSAVSPGAAGKGGNINITTGSLSVINGGQMVASTFPFGQGDAGSVNINAQSTVSFDGVDVDGFYSAAFSSVYGVGKGGDINITTRSLSITNGSQLVASTFGQGDAGNIRINDTQVVNISGVNPNGASSALFTSTHEGAKGNAGEITVNAAVFRVADGAVVNAQTFNADNGGSITINAKNFEATGGGQILTTTRSNGKAGDITINANNSITLSGSDPTFSDRVAKIGEENITNQGSASGVFANTSVNSTGQGGDLTIKTGQFSIRDGAQVTASSSGAGDAGNIRDITVRSLNLDNGSITTTSLSGNGGNIQNIQVQDLLLLRNNSQISTTAGIDNLSSGNGGNININTGFIVAVPFENSNITANAFGGSGGNIQIDTQGIFGIASQTQETSRSDITASSQLGINGAIQITTPAVDPTQGLVALPAAVVDVSGLIAQGCAAGTDSEVSQFVATGRGGLPPNPGEVISTDDVWKDGRSSRVLTNNRSNTTTTTKQPANTAAVPMMPATGWVKNGNGIVTLVATAPTATIHTHNATQKTCHAR